MVAYKREWEGDYFIVLNNLIDQDVHGTLPTDAPTYVDVLTGETIKAGDYTLPPYGFVWLKPVND